MKELIEIAQRLGSTHMVLEMTRRSPGMHKDLREWQDKYDAIVLEFEKAVKNQTIFAG